MFLEMEINHYVNIEAIDRIDDIIESWKHQILKQQVKKLFKTKFKINKNVLTVFGKYFRQTVNHQFGLLSVF